MHDSLQNGELRLAKVVDYFHKLKQKEQNYHQNLVKVMYDEPKKRALVLDEEIKKKNGEKLPLTGFVMSIKDSLIFKNTDCTCGFAVNVGNKTYYKKNEKVIKHLIK